ncbi:hypothetical protein SAMN04487768_3231 [Burkholderia sp. b13]|nr:hypothetical protein SAMN04487768_3231 [Burkholderia sp. b13]
MPGGMAPRAGGNRNYTALRPPTATALAAGSANAMIARLRAVRRPRQRTDPRADCADCIPGIRAPVSVIDVTRQITIMRLGERVRIAGALLLRSGRHADAMPPAAFTE